MKNLLKHYSADLPSGLVVFLVALPLCLGIAVASGADPISGLITGIVGGIVAGMISGSHLAVSGPAAGLTVIVLDAINAMPSFDVFIAAVVMAGIIQVVLGYLKAGLIGSYFPTSVIRGMLTAIGLILIFKQLPHFFGFDKEAFGNMDYDDHQGGNTFSDLFAAVNHIHTGAFIIGAISLAILLFWELPIMKKMKFTKIIPGALIAVIMSIVVNASFFTGDLAITGGHLVKIPIIEEGDGVTKLLTFPNFGTLFSGSFWSEYGVEFMKISFVIAIIASLETLLSVEAIDKLDPQKRHSPLNQELKAQGVGNIVAGLLGGLPMTAVIVRSSANLNSGSKTKMATIYHGILLISCVLLIPNILNMIPLSALAAILLVVGYKLAKPALFVKQYQLGMQQFIPFVVTVVAIIYTDLLTGILIGMSLGVFYILRANYRVPYSYQEEKLGTSDGKAIKLVLSEHVSFLNKASLLAKLEGLEEGSNVVIDGSKCKEIDYDALVVIEDFKITAKNKHIGFDLVNMPQ